MRMSILVLMLVASFYGIPSTAAGDEASLAAESRLGTQTDAFFPPEKDDWQTSQHELVSGIEKAETLRRRLLAGSPDAPSGATGVADMIRDFQTATATATGVGGAAPALRYLVDKFDVTAERLTRQIRGDDAIAPEAFDAFTGRWFGRWDESDVNHDWLPSTNYSPPRAIAAGHPPIRSLQYAWISNGFGWNYLSSRDGDPNRNYVLGMVYYFSHPNYRDIIEEKPHVGFADGPTRLVWITEFELYLEEAFPESISGQSDCYVITGLRHNLFNSHPDVSSARVSPHAVQAIYTRDPSDRPSFQKILWKKD